ncbi:MAG: ABC transporter permease [Chloroflexota bacterium]
MFTLKRAVRNLWRRRYRTLLVSSVLALCVTVLVSTASGIDASEAAAAAMLEEYRERAEDTVEETERWMTGMVVTGGGGPLSGRPVSEDVVDEIASMDHVAAVVPMIMIGVGEADPGAASNGVIGSSYAYVVHGVPVDTELDGAYHVLPVSIAEGRTLQEADDHQVLLPDELTGYFGAGVGDSIELEGTPVDVVGIYSSALWGKDIFMDLRTAQELLDMDGRVSMVAVFADTSSAVEDVANEVQSNYPGATVIPLGGLQGQAADYIQRQQEGLLESLDDDLSMIRTFGFRLILEASIIGALLIFGLMFYTVRERTKEIGTLKALGFSGSEIMRQFLYEGVSIGLIGAAIGIALAAIAASLLSRWLLGPTEALSVSAGVTLGAIILGLGVAIATSALGSLYPAWRASRVSPMEALRRE